MYTRDVLENEIMRILVVDDEPEIREVLNLVLTQQGWLVDQAASAEEAISRCARDHYDVVVMDNLMPGRLGIEAARELVMSGTDATVIIFAGHLSKELLEECHTLGLMAVDKINWQELVLRCHLLATRSHLAENVAAAARRPVAAMAV
jgi:CheY-like chemotaxis protein